MCAILAFIGCIFSLKCFSFLDVEYNHGRSNNLDGLRYVLASLVVFHHMDYFGNYFENRDWYGSSLYINYLGRIGVAAFFMITAFLFWGKVRKVDNVDWVGLYKDRLFRIVPLALFVSAVAVMIILYLTNFPKVNKIVVPDLLSWFDGGLFDRKPDLNGMAGSRIVIAGVTWTLRWEWFFYFSLPALFFFRKRGLEMSITLFMASCFLLKDYSNSYYLWCYFSAGIMAKELAERINLSKIKVNLSFCFIATLFYLSEPVPNTEVFAVYMAAFFILILKGFDLFGVLSSKGFVRLGHLSYSIYLNQGLLLFCTFTFLDRNIIVKHEQLVLSLMFALLCFASLITYKFVELPFIRIGKKVGSH